MNIAPTDLPVILLYNLDRAWPEAERQEIRDLTGCLERGLLEAGHPTLTACLEDQGLEAVLMDFDPGRCIVFNWCEEFPGVPRSAGLVARRLDELGFIYTGADARTLQSSYDKPAVKRHLEGCGIRIPRWQVREPGTLTDWDCFPAIVKPAFEHCSNGITHEAVVGDVQQLTSQAGRLFATFGQPVLIEDFIAGREFHVTIVGNGRLQVFPIAEMDFSAIQDERGRLCTYASKFIPGSQDYQSIGLNLPAPLSARQKRQLEEVALAAYRATCCRDYARLDIRERDGQFYVLDVNPNADLSPDTSVALSAELAGFSFGQLGSLLVNLAAHRHPACMAGWESREQPAPLFGMSETVCA